MMASTPLSPHFSPNMFGGAFGARDRPHHAIPAGNQAMSSPGHNNRPHLTNDAVALTANPNRNITGVPGLAQHVSEFQQQAQHQRLLHHPAGGLGELTAAENQGQLADPPLLLHAQAQGHQQAPPATWFPPGYGADPLYRDDHLQRQQQQVVVGVTASPSAADPPVMISAAGGPSSSSSSRSNSNINAGGQLFDFGYAAPPPGEQSFLGGEYADITPLSTAAAGVTAHPQPTATTFDFNSSPWLPRLQDNSSVTLTPNIAAIAAAELSHDARKHSKGSSRMEDDGGDLRDPAWDDDSEYQHRRGAGTGARAGVAGGIASPRHRRQQRKGRRRAADADGSVEDADEDEPTSPAGRTSVSGRSNKSASVASTTASSSKTGPAPAPRLRSASRTSKNASQKPAETAEERRTRASHNLVEKQYRNRLNAQFEGLLNALPEQVRGPAGTGGGADGGDESDPQPADQERRVSKAEVLDMARRHIKSLEREREELQRERGDLLRNLEMMEREMAASRGGRFDEFLDVEGPPDERGGPWRNA
ncbi:helix-loop-helix DNA-binding domain-containing protein [Colletotrichum plurivorum]|uniref:Helix-loop-helix DNA-binding domain-containing protein n=1 Tax=Colletotrichum plurivorum TaxID=2175906 RepID=A0A8H6KGE6_9PEZI|nr:helix-loop-helix DNA-binding domain-containing protein [Colletotrichum plurivorum]